MKWIVFIFLLVLLAGLGLFLLSTVDDSSEAGLPDPIGKISHLPIAESSGLAASRKHSGFFWTHNDQGNPPAIFAISREGALKAEFRVEDNADDWEAITVDDRGNLYIADIGNNDRKRKTVHVHRLPEPDLNTPPAGDAPLKPDRTWRLAFPDKPFDAEALFIHGGYGYIISKTKPRDPAELYRFPLEGEGDEKQRVGLERVAEIPMESPVTDAALSQDGARLAVMSEKELRIFTVNGMFENIANAPTKLYPINRKHDIEGITFTEGGILASSEMRHLYLFTEPGQ